MISYLDVCDTPEKCQEYLAKAMVQVETLEGRFADSMSSSSSLREAGGTVRRLESRKVRLIAERNSGVRAAGLGRADPQGHHESRAEPGRHRPDQRVLRLGPMIDRIRETIERSRRSATRSRPEDIANRLKTIHPDTIRQLKDKQAL